MKRRLKSSWRTDDYIMSIKEQLVYINLVVSCYDKSETTRLSFATLQERTRIGDALLEKCLDNLEKHGFIKRGVDFIKVLKQKNFEFFTHSVLGLVSDTATIVAFRLASCRDTNSS